MRNNLNEGDHFILCGQGLQKHVLKATKVKNGRPVAFDWVEAPSAPHVQAAFRRYLEMGWDVERVPAPTKIGGGS